jgi:hypothetical protein
MFKQSYAMCYLKGSLSYFILGLRTAMIAATVLDSVTIKNHNTLKTPNESMALAKPFPLTP